MRDTDCKTYERPSIESCRPLYLTFAHTPTHHEARDEEIPTHAVRPAGTETGADEGGPRAALEKEDGEDDAEADAEGGLDEEVREAAVPL